MLNDFTKLILIFLIIFTPIAFGSMELWAFSIMELGILLIIILWAIQSLLRPALRRVQGSPEPRWIQGLSPEPRWIQGLSPEPRWIQGLSPEPYMVQGELQSPHSTFVVILLSLFLLLILFQLLPLPSGILKIISPKTYALRSALSLEPSASTFPLSFFPFLTQIEFFKWLTLIGLFIFLLRWNSLEQSDRTIKQLIIVIMMVGVLESLYGMFEFFSGHHYILNLDGSALISSVTGTFINRNYLAGYLLMVIPLSVGYLFSRETISTNRFMGWRHWLSSLDGKTLLIGFSVIVMVLGLLFTASRMGILSLLLSFSLISFLFRNPEKGKRSSKTVVLIFGLALLWAAWIGLDAVISRFFSVSEGFEERWKFWVNTFQIFKDFPFLGSGLGTFIQVFPMYRSFHITGLVTHAENDFLQLASEVGLLGIGLLLVTFLFLFFKGVSRIRSMSYENPKRYMGIGGLVGILTLMFHSLVERNIQVPSNAFLYTILWVIVLRISITKKGAISVYKMNQTNQRN
jgi:O-antigen ligase